MEQAPDNDAARPLADLLRQWSDWAARRRDGEPVPLPLVTLHLRSGRDLRGTVLDVSETPAGEHVALAIEPTGEESSDSARSYMPVGAIEAITVLSFGSTESEEPAAPARLPFRRELAGWEDTLEELFGTPIAVPSDFSREHLGVLSTLYRHLQEFFEAWSSDPASRESIARKVGKIELLVGDEASVALTDRTLTITTCVNVFDRMAPRRLKNEIEALL